MIVTKIGEKYCTGGKVQLMLPDASQQLILSSGGYVHLRSGDTTIHCDPAREEMPHRDNYTTYLFDCGTIYVSFREDRLKLFELTFLYFVRTKHGEALCAKLDLRDFVSEPKTTQILSKKELEQFLYALDATEQAKCILEGFGRIKYVTHFNEAAGIPKDNFLDLSDEGIISEYNRQNKPNAFSYLLLNENQRAKKLAEKSWEVHSIEDVKKFVLTYHGMLNSFSPMLLVVTGNVITLSDFKVTFLKKNCFEVQFTRRTLALSSNILSRILSSADSCEYTGEQPFSDDE